MSHCRACDALEIVPHFKVAGYTLLKCNRCQYVQVEPVPDEAALEALYHQNYFRRGKYVADTAGQREQTRRIEWLHSCGLSAGASVLDFGCATGEFIAAAKDNFDMWGADISVDAIAKARSSHPELADKLFTTDTIDQISKERRFDAVVLWDVIEHVRDPVATLKQMAGYLKPGGIIAISTPNIGAPLAVLMGKRWAFMTPPEHLGFFNRSSLERLCTRVGIRPTLWMTRGKWVNAHFLLYKLRRVFPAFVPQAIVDLLGRSRGGRLCLYVPSGDIQYLGATKH